LRAPQRPDASEHEGAVAVHLRGKVDRLLSLHMGIDRLESPTLRREAGKERGAREGALPWRPGDQHLFANWFGGRIPAYCA
jgi:hypothetical protein